MNDDYDKDFYLDEIPLLITGTTSLQLEKYFEGRLPKEGDSVEYYCYYADDNTLKLKFKVRE